MSSIEVRFNEAIISFRSPSRPTTVKSLPKNMKPRSDPPVLPKRPDKHLPLKENVSTQTFHIKDWVWNERKLVGFGVISLVFLLTSVNVLTYMFFIRNTDCHYPNQGKTMYQKPVTGVTSSTTETEPVYVRAIRKLQSGAGIIWNFLSKIESISDIDRIFTFNGQLWCLCGRQSKLVIYNLDFVLLKSRNLDFIGAEILCVHLMDSYILVAHTNGLDGVNMYDGYNRRFKYQIKGEFASDITEYRGQAYVMSCNIIYRVRGFSIQVERILDKVCQPDNKNLYKNDRLLIKSKIIYAFLYEKQILLMCSLRGSLRMYKKVKMEYQSVFSAWVGDNHVLMIPAAGNSVTLNRLYNYRSIKTSYEQKYGVKLKDIVVIDEIYFLLFEDGVHRLSS